jgi:peroxiredoxin
MKTWRNEVGLTADLLCDADRAIAMAYGAAESADQERPKRISVLVGPDGNVARIYESPDPETHPAEVLADLS